MRVALPKNIIDQLVKAVQTNLRTLSLTRKNTIDSRTATRHMRRRREYVLVDW